MKHLNVLLLLVLCAGLNAQYCEQVPSNSSLGTDLIPMWARYVVTYDISSDNVTSNALSKVRLLYNYRKDDLHVGIECSGSCGTATGFCGLGNAFFSFVIKTDTGKLAIISITPQNCSYTVSSLFNFPPGCPPNGCDAASFFDNITSYYNTLNQSMPSVGWTATTKGDFAIGTDILFTIQNFSNIWGAKKPDLVNTPFAFSYLLVSSSYGNNPTIIHRTDTLPSWKLPDQCITDTPAITLTVSKVNVLNYNEISFKNSVTTMLGIRCSDLVIILSTSQFGTSTNVEFFVAANIFPNGDLYQSMLDLLGSSGTFFDCNSINPSMMPDYISVEVPFSVNSCFPPFSVSDFPPNTQCSFATDGMGRKVAYLLNGDYHWKSCVYQFDLAQMCDFQDSTGLFTRWSVQAGRYGFYYLEPFILNPQQVSLCDGKAALDASPSYSDLPVRYQWNVSCYPDSAFCNHIYDTTIKTHGPILKLTWSQFDVDSLELSEPEVSFTLTLFTDDNTEGYSKYADLYFIYGSIVTVYPLVPDKLGVSPSGARLLADPSLSCGENSSLSYNWQYIVDSQLPFPGTFNNAPEMIVNPMITPDNGTLGLGGEPWFAFILDSYINDRETRSNGEVMVYMTVTPKVLSYFTLGSSCLLPDKLNNNALLIDLMNRNRIDIFYPPLALDWEQGPPAARNPPGGALCIDYGYSECDAEICYPNRAECSQPFLEIYFTKDEIPVIQFKIITLPLYGKMLPDQPLVIQAIASTGDEFEAGNTNTQLKNITFRWNSFFLNLNDSRVADTVTDSVLTLKSFYWKYLIHSSHPLDNILKIDVTVQALLFGNPLPPTTSTIDLTPFLPTRAPAKGRILVTPFGNNTFQLEMVDWTDDDVYNYEEGLNDTLPRLLRYQFKYFQTTTGKNSAEVTLSPLQYSFSFRTKLPTGNITVVGYAYDCWGASSRVVSIPEVVTTKPVDETALENLKNDVNTALANGNPEAAAASLTQLLMYINSDPTFSDAEHRKYALMTIQKIGNITFSYDMYAQLLTLFPYVTGAVDKLDTSLIQDTLGTISTMLEHPFAEDGINPEEAKSLLVCFSDALEFKHQQSDLDETSQFNISSSIWNTEGDVVLKLFEKLDCNSPSTVLEAPNINIFIKKGPADGSFPGAPLSSGAAQSSFEFPANTIQGDCIGVHYVSYVSNIFDFSTKKYMLALLLSDIVSPAGEIIGLNFFDENGDPIQTDNLANSVTINVAMKKIDTDNFTPSCTFWNEITLSWDDKGCVTKGTVDVSPTETILVCHCTHLTNFTAVVSHNDNKDYTTFIIIAGICGGVAVVLLSAILGVVLVRSGKKQPRAQSPENPVPAKSPLVIIPPSEIVIEEKIGGGAFGEVYKGTYLGTTAVALKKLTSETNSEEFEEEASLLQNLRHTNIVFFLGIYTSAAKEKYMVTEFMPKGSVLSMLKKSGHKLSIQELINLCKDAAAGMSYLEAYKIVHRDLAARNLLISGSAKHYTVKVADFGMSRKVEGMSAQTAPEKFPVKWTAPEAIESRQYSSKADVWSFGVTMWEIFQLGASPYSDMTNKEAAAYVIGGKRLDQPKTCPEEVYKLMLQCWSTKPEDRPTFKQIYTELKLVTQSLKDGSSSDESPLEKPVRKVTAHKPDYQNDNHYSNPNSSQGQPPIKADESGAYHHSGGYETPQVSGSKTNRYSTALGRDGLTSDSASSDNVEMKEMKKEKKKKKKKKKPEYEYEFDKSTPRTYDKA